MPARMGIVVAAAVVEEEERGYDGVHTRVRVGRGHLLSLLDVLGIGVVRAVCGGGATIVTAIDSIIRRCYATRICIIRRCYATRICLWPTYVPDQPSHQDGAPPNACAERD